MPFVTHEEPWEIYLDLSLFIGGTRAEFANT